MGSDRDGPKNDGPVSGIENGPQCFTRDSGVWVERQRERERAGEVLTTDCKVSGSIFLPSGSPNLTVAAQETCSGR